MRSVISAIMLSFVIGAGTALAQAPTPAPAPAKMSPDRKAVSKACSDQATAKGLHGKERKKFRSECKHNGGKSQ